MKGGGGGGGGGQPYAIPPGKRRWNFLVIAVLCLVFLSMLVPLIFLLGLHNGFHSSPGKDSAFAFSISRLDLHICNA